MVTEWSTKSYNYAALHLQQLYVRMLAGLYDAKLTPRYLESFVNFNHPLRQEFLTVLRRVFGNNIALNAQIYFQPNPFRVTKLGKYVRQD